MKTSERHHLKEDDFQIALGRAREQLVSQKQPIALITSIVVVAIVLIGGYVYWQRSTNEKASALFADALVTASAPVVAPQTPAALAAPGTAAPPPPPANSFPTEQARADAAITKFTTAAQAYPSSKPGIAANYHAAALLAQQGKASEAETRFNDVIQRDGDGLYGRMAKLGIATLQVQSKKYDQAIATLQTLSQRTDTDMPVDAVLMQLGDAYQRAGRTPDAVRTYTRVVDEFPTSAYASDARRRIDDLKAAAPATSARS
jgi:predicted negative regulator of RcsB-dependent stress response